MKANPLPMGWKEMLVRAKHPLDAGTSEEDWKKTAHPRHPRTEKVCWFRGDRYVRVCEEFDSDTKETKGFAVHYGNLSKETKDDLAVSNIQDFSKALIEAKVIMRIGGRPQHL